MPEKPSQDLNGDGQARWPLLVRIWGSRTGGPGLGRMHWPCQCRPLPALRMYLYMDIHIHTLYHERSGWPCACPVAVKRKPRDPSGGYIGSIIDLTGKYTGGTGAAPWNSVFPPHIPLHQSSSRVRRSSKGGVSPRRYVTARHGHPACARPSPPLQRRAVWLCHPLRCVLCSFSHPASPECFI